METNEQLTLFGDETKKFAKKIHTNSSGNPIVFRDYESFVAKFADKSKTTDDCYTPKDVYEAVVKYVGTVVDLSDKISVGKAASAEYGRQSVHFFFARISVFVKQSSVSVYHGINIIGRLHSSLYL